MKRWFSTRPRTSKGGKIYEEEEECVHATRGISFISPKQRAGIQEREYISPSEHFSGWPQAPCSTWMERRSATTWAIGVYATLYVWGEGEGGGG